MLTGSAERGFASARPYNRHSAMPRVDKDYAYHQMPTPRVYQRPSRRGRLALELSIGLAVLALIPIGVSVRMPLWVKLIGWAVMVACTAAQSVFVVQRWRERRMREELRTRRNLDR
ncbi:MAG TPA: hypothetical protein VL990_12270 [Acidobacteriaceae bacterium]|nr:hypothetical protein [Acidobacteriaceae bacterium]